MLTANDLSSSQREVYDRLCSGESLFITGAAGTGKSEIVQLFRQEHSDRNILVCAPTGIAAVRCGGQTLHQAFRIHGNVEGYFSRDVEGKHVGWLCGLDVLIIDEISMCRIDLFEYVMKCLVATGISDIQIICVGDFFQLPPVLDMRREGGRGFKADWGELLYAFQSEYWNILHPVILNEVFRTDDHGYIQHLNRIRIGDKSAVEYFNRNCQNEANPEAITICGRNDDAHRINESHLASYMPSAEIRVYGAAFTENYRQWLSVPVSEEIALYPGMRVITVKNDPVFHLVNGEIGTVETMQETSINVRFSDRTQEISYYLWETLDREGNTISFAQLPIQQAEAISIHKSQGQTFDQVNVNPYAFEAGQLYVALSRCSSIEGMHLIHEIDPDQLKVSPVVHRFYEEIGALDIDEEQYEEIEDTAEENGFDRSGWRNVNVKRRVGFDKVLISLTIKSFDREKFINRIREYQDDNVFVCRYKEPTKRMPFLRYIDVTVPYSYIKLEIGLNTLVMKKNPTGNGEDVCILTLHVPPIQEHEVLGNISNLSVEEEQNYVRKIMQYIEEVYGIGFDDKVAIIRSAEININLRGGYIVPHWGHFYIDNYNVLKVVKPYIGKEFNNGGYSRSKPDEPEFRYKGTDSKKIEDMINSGKHHLKSPDVLFDSNNNISLYTPGSRATSINCYSETRVFKVYDKKYETKKETKGTDHEILGMSELTRIEYVLKKSKTIKSYMGDANLFELTQENIEDAFHRLSEKLVKKPIERFKDRNEDQLKALFRSVKRGRGQWVKNLVISLIRLANQEDIYMDLSWNKLKDLVSEIPKEIVKTNRTYACKRIFSEIEKLDGNGIKVAEEGVMPYTNQLVRMMMTIAGEEDQDIVYSIENRMIDKDDYVTYNYVRDKELMEYLNEQERIEEEEKDDWEIYQDELLNRIEEEEEKDIQKRTGIDLDW